MSKPLEEIDEDESQTSLVSVARADFYEYWQGHVENPDAPVHPMVASVIAEAYEDSPFLRGLAREADELIAAYRARKRGDADARDASVQPTEGFDPFAERREDKVQAQDERMLAQA